MRAGLLSAVLALTACGGDYLGRASCEAPVQQLTPDLTAHIAAGDGEGSFAYDPTGSLVGTIDGSYDTVTGDFSWMEIGGPESWIAEAQVEGFGYAAPNGDLDVVGERVITDVLDVEIRQQFRIERIGCQVERRIRDWSTGGEREQVETGSYAGSTYTYTRDVITGESTLTSEGSRDTLLDFTESTTRTAGEGTYQAETTGNWGDNTAATEFTQTVESRNGTIQRDGSSERFSDGSRSVTYTDVYANGAQYTWSYDLDYAGNGTGTVDTGQGVCTLTFTNNQCRYTCPGGQQGNC